jgi:chorismate mutase / prephenate dehydratase
MENSKTDKISSISEQNISKGQNVSLSQLREKVNTVDSELINLLKKRRELAHEIFKTKDDNKAPFRDEQREEGILRSLISEGRALGLDAHFVTKIFHEIFNDSVRLQYSSLINRQNLQSLPLKKVGYHGIEGSFCQLAAEQFFGKLTIENEKYKTQGLEANNESIASEIQPPFTMKTVGFQKVEDIFTALESGTIDEAFVPVENTTIGAINEVLDQIIQSSLYIIGEDKFRVDHCLLGLKDIPLKDIKKIYCSSLGYADCKKFLLRLEGAHVEILQDSAVSARRAADEKDPYTVAIASEKAATLYGLKILNAQISNTPDNYIRYVAVSKKQIKVDTRIPSKTSITMSTPHHPGALAECLLVFREHNINITRLESRPVPENPWEQMFYLDFEGNMLSPEVDLALKELTRCTRFLRVLGSYPTIDINKVEVNLINGAARTSKDSASAEIPAAAPVVEAPKTSSEVKKSKKSYRLASRDHKEEDTIITVRGIKIGGNNFVVMAGPCSVESENQIMQCARHARENGAVILRGGCFKPRTSPYSFQGMGYEGLDILKTAGEMYDMPIITEVMAPEDVEPVAVKADIIQIGARNMQNFTLLKVLGKVRRPIMLKRGLSSSIEDLLNAAEYILAHGNHQVILCERGIRTFETATRSTLDISAVPVLKRETHLPVIVDPSHAAGERDLVPPLALASKAVGAHGIIVEFHPDPEKALSDGPQALRFPQFAQLMSELNS